MSLTIALCRDSEVAEVMEFFDRYWQAGHILSRDEELLRWQFRPPAARVLDGDLSILIARENGRMTGTLGLIPVDFNLRGEAVPGVWLAMLRSLQDGVTPGIGMKLMSSVRELPFAMAGTLGMNETVVRLFRFFGYRPVVTRRHLAILNPALTATLAGIPETSLPRAAASQAVMGVGERTTAPSDLGLVPIEPGTPLPVAWDDVWTTELAPQSVGAARDRAYLDWRFTRHPRFAYHRLMAVRDGRPAGLAVFRREIVRDQPVAVVRLVECLGDAEAQATLAGRVLEEAREWGAAFVDAQTGPATPQPGLERAGFRALSPDEAAMVPQFFQPLLHGTSGTLRGAFWASPELRACHGAFEDAPSLLFTGADCDQDRPN